MPATLAHGTLCATVVLESHWGEHGIGDATCMHMLSKESAGAVLVLYAIVTTAKVGAAPSRRAVQNFCRGAPDLCAVVCHTPSDCEGLLAQGFSCEQRTGHLLVAEGRGESRVIVTAYADAFAFCWYPNASYNYSELPDPSTTYVPPYEPADDKWHCEWCFHRARKCTDRATRFSELCGYRLERVYKQHCEDTMRRYGRPYGRRGVPMEANHECEALLTYGPGDEASDGYTQRANRLLTCKSRLLAECLRDFSDSHPDEQYENRIPLKISEVASIGLDAGYERASVVHWGGSIGFVEACAIAEHEAAGQCTVEQTTCEANLNPNTSCLGWLP